MKKSFVTAILAVGCALTLAACVVEPGPGPLGVVAAPILVPPVVVAAPVVIGRRGYYRRGYYARRGYYGRPGYARRFRRGY